MASDTMMTSDAMTSPKAPSTHGHSHVPSHELNYDHYFGLGDDSDDNHDEGMSSTDMMTSEDMSSVATEEDLDAYF